MGFEPSSNDKSFTSFGCRIPPFLTIRFSAPRPSVPKIKFPMEANHSVETNVADAASPKIVRLPLSFG